MDSTFLHAFGGILAVSAFLYGIGHAIVALAPGHPHYPLIRNIVLFREVLVVPCTILLLSLQDLMGGYQLGPIGIATMLSSIISIFFLSVAPRIRTLITNQTRDNHALSSVVKDAADGADSDTFDPTPQPDHSALTHSHLVSALDELREQRKIQQVIWDLPVGIVLVNDDFQIQSRVGGLIRSSGFPTELSGLGKTLPEKTSYRLAAQTVLKTKQRNCFEVHCGGKTLQITVGPWISMAGRIRGVTFLVTAFQEQTLTDEAEVRYHA